MGEVCKAKEALIEMETKETKPNTATYTTLLAGYCKVGNFLKQKRYDERRFKDCHDVPDVYTYTSYVHRECISGKVDAALNLFNEMPIKGLVPDVVSYTTMISVLSKEDILQKFGVPSLSAVNSRQRSQKTGDILPYDILLLPILCHSVDAGGDVYKF
ncbi:hypothetical protein RND71_035908 [Anisodus tanguticus]|uniref:Pentatricopeptide repeat-containing protein n=1 Tax=Anisodus tanguticus TaxID=243964 RepID=A0AAE1R7S4_9SOLA|nr:hypothetical protein RND71_035908 [Anisodus tanguticus]